MTAVSTVIYNLVHEMCVAVEWLNASGDPEPDSADNELLSLRQVCLAAKNHFERMRTLRAVAEGSGSS